MLALRSPPPQAIPVSFLVSPPPGTKFFDTVETIPFALSPDGASIGMVASEPSGKTRVWVRAVSSVTPHALSGTDGADGLFWSPDSQSLAFFAGSKLKRVNIESGTVVPLCDVREGIGKSGTWGRDGQMLFAEVGGDAIYRTSTAGEAPVVVVKTTQANSAIGPRWPSVLPDGRHFFYLEKASGASGSLMLGEVGQTPRRVMAIDSNVAYVDPGYVLFAREGILLGQQLDVANGRATGEPFSIASPVRYFAPTGAAEFSASKGGALAYRERGSVTRVARLDRDGKELGTLGASAQNARLYVSRDGRTAAFDRQQSGMGTMDVWSIDLARGVEARLTMDPGTEVGPVLIPGSHDVIFGSTKRGGPPNLVRKNLETGIEEFLMPPARALQMPEDVSPDGKVLLFSQRAEAGGNQFWTLVLSGKETPSPFLTTGADDAGARIAPDGRSVAYLSSDSGRREVPRHVVSRARRLHEGIQWRRQNAAMEFGRPPVVLCRHRRATDGGCDSNDGCIESGPTSAAVRLQRRAAVGRLRRAAGWPVRREHFGGQRRRTAIDRRLELAARPQT